MQTYDPKVTTAGPFLMGIKRIFSKVCKVMGPTQLDIKIIKENPALATEINKAVQTLMSILKAVPLPRAAIPHGHIPVGIVGAGDGSPE